jgi:hypothetical protein
MDTGKCCFDCIFCIMANAPLEAGINHVCMNPRGRQHFTDVWDPPCIYFKDEMSVYENSKYFN